MTDVKCKKQNKKIIQKIAFILLIFIMFLTGVCQNKNQADSCLRYMKFNVEQSHVFCEKEVVADSDFCANEQLGISHTSYLNGHEGIVNRGERIFTVFLIFLFWAFLAENIFLCRKAIYIVDETLLVLQHIIIRYIHRKDGTKGHLPMRKK